MRSVLFLLTLSIVLTTYGQTKQNRDVCCFNSVEISGAFNVYLRMGDESAVTVIADEDVINDVITEVDNNVLEVSFDGDWWDMGKSSDDVKIYITLSTVKNLEFSGACVVSSKNSLRGSTINIESSGASKMNLEFACSTLDFEISGATKATFSGTCGKLNIEASGASAINAADLQTEIVNMDISGASKADVYASERLNIEASGASKVRYKGSPSITKDVSGASSISKL